MNRGLGKALGNTIGEATVPGDKDLCTIQNLSYIFFIDLILGLF